MPKKSAGLSAAAFFHQRRVLRLAVLLGGWFLLLLLVLLRFLQGFDRFLQGGDNVLFDALRDLADWFVQLWAESLGKHREAADKGVGPTPVGALGATDQHSKVQLFMEGPPDKTVAFVADQSRLSTDDPIRAAQQAVRSYLPAGDDAPAGSPAAWLRVLLRRPDEGGLGAYPVPVSTQLAEADVLVASPLDLLLLGLGMAVLPVTTWRRVRSCSRPSPCSSPALSWKWRAKEIQRVVWWPKTYSSPRPT